MKAVPGSATIRARNASALRSPDWVSCNRKSGRSEEHTSELQSQSNLVCRLLLEKKKKFKCTSVRRSIILLKPSSVIPFHHYPNSDIHLCITEPNAYRTSAVRLWQSTYCAPIVN